MSRLFDDAKSESLSINVAAITAYPFAMACWFYSDSDALQQALIWCGDKDGSNCFSRLGIQGGVAGDPVAAFSHNYGKNIACTANTTSGYSVNTWHHAAGIWLTTSERHAYIDGGSKGSNTNAVGAMSGHDSTAIGGNRDSTPGQYMSGMIAEVGIWDLTNWGANNAERETNFERAIASMAKGFSPSFFPLGLKLYCPLVRLAINIMNSIILGESGTVISPHCRVFNPVSPKSIIT